MLFLSVCLPMHVFKHENVWEVTRWHFQGRSWSAPTCSFQNLFNFNMGGVGLPLQKSTRGGAQHQRQRYWRLGWRSLFAVWTLLSTWCQKARCSMWGRLRRFVFIHDTISVCMHTSYSFAGSYLCFCCYDPREFHFALSTCDYSLLTRPPPSNSITSVVIASGSDRTLQIDLFIWRRWVSKIWSFEDDIELYYITTPIALVRSREVVSFGVCCIGWENMEAACALSSQHE